MIDKFLKSRFIILYLLPFILGCLTLFSFQPFNFSVINFFVLPILFYLIVYINKRSKNVYRKKPYKKNFFIFGTSFGFGFYLGGIHWIVNSLTFDESFKFLIPLGLIFIPLFLSLFFSININHWSFSKFKHWFNFSFIRRYCAIRFFKSKSFNWISLESMGL